MKHLLLTYVAFTALGCGEHPEPINTGPSVFGYYKFRDTMLIGYSGIELHSDSTYFYSSGMCVGSSMDSGSFSMKGDTLFLKSVLESKVDTSNHGFDQVRPLTGDKYLIRGDKIFYRLENGKYDTSATWVKSDSTK